MTVAFTARWWEGHHIWAGQPKALLRVDHTPQRLTHATCHGREYGIESLVDVMNKHDVRQFQERVRRSKG